MLFCPNNLHEYALKQICRYLKLTRDLGLILNHNRELFNINIYPDADFYGMYRHEKPSDTVFGKSLTGYIITFSDFPVLW